MFSSQRFSLFIGLSLLVLSATSANKSNAQTLVVESLDPQEESTSSQGGNNQVEEILANLRATGQLLGDNGSFGTGNYFYLTPKTQRSSPPVEGVEAESETIEGAPLTSTLTAFKRSSSTQPNATRLIKSANQNQDLTNLPLLQLPLEVGTLPDTSKPLEIEPSVLITYESLPTMVSTPEPLVSFLPWLGFAALGLLPTRCKSKK